ncbi:hypothetical protein [Clostridium sardiniense]|uniref:hypothetical protein n=1 Tax=Clostridium sardiniense TaxID=29369 RepID=UPI003D32ABA3
MRKEYCEVCGSTHLVEEHHIIKRGQAPALINCKLNYKYLCYEHHRGTYGVHGKYGSRLDHELKKSLQDNLNLMFGADIYYAVEQIKEKLDITLKEAERLIKTLLPIEGKCKGIDIIRACMGGKLVLRGEYELQRTI